MELFQLAESTAPQMRDLLLQYGADEGDKDRERWDLRQRADHRWTYRHVADGNMAIQYFFAIAG